MSASDVNEDGDYLSSCLWFACIMMHILLSFRVEVPSAEKARTIDTVGLDISVAFDI